MLILALDTSSADGSAALVRDSTIVVERRGDASRIHGTRLPLELMAVLRDGGAQLADIDRLAVVCGPGSFTGLRVGIATMQGLAIAGALLVTPVPTFEALAWHARGSADAIATWTEAHRGEVFAALFGPDARTILAPATALSASATLDAWHDALPPQGRIRFVGDGAVRYRDVIVERLGERAAIDAEAPRLAGAAGLIAAAEPERAVRPHAIVPIYVRRPDVELARDRRHAMTKL
jgi:tRNA threonylcarbamoyladenosine biosynthesis protein TsaB